MDNDGNGLIDCDDPDCQNNPAHPNCGETLCGDGKDNDGDGKADCADPDCFGTPACKTETFCSDGHDNDGDGLIDCVDPDCSESESCPEICNDGIDNDGDGFIDCADLECMTEESCPSVCDQIATPTTSQACADTGCPCTPECYDPVRFFISADGRLEDADPTRDLDFQAAAGGLRGELEFDGYGFGYITAAAPLRVGSTRIRPVVVHPDGRPVTDVVANGGLLVETYPLVPHLPGIISGHQTGGAALLNRTITPGGELVRGSGIALTFTPAVTAVGVWVLDDFLEASRYVMQVELVSGEVFTSGPLDSLNGASLAIEGFLGAVAPTGIVRALLMWR